MEKNKKITLLLVGDSTWPMYVSAFYEEAKKIINAKLFDFEKLNSGKINRKNIILRIENKLATGIDVYDRNQELLKYVTENEIKYVFLYAARIIHWKTIEKMKRMGIVILAYCNDNPFSDYYPPYFWRNIIKSVAYCDIVYSYRKSDIEKYMEKGAKDVRLLRSYYIESRNYRIDEPISTDIKIPKVIFLGHMENDERREYLDALVNRGIEIGVRETPEWKQYAKNRENIVIFHETVRRYNEIINGAEIALVFLSKINQDTYTRRCFEIPVTGTLMLAPYNDDLATLFLEDEEAVFYRSKEEFVAKVEYYLEHPEEGRRIGLNGRERVLRDGHEAKDRVCQMIEDMICYGNEMLKG